MFDYLSKRIKSFGWAFRGLFDLFRHHPNAQIHLVAVLVVTSAGFWVSLSANEWALVVLCMGLVVALEAVNSGLEYLTDLVSPDFHPLAGKAKDIAAAAVLVGAITSVIVAALVFIPKF